MSEPPHAGRAEAMETGLSLLGWRAALADAAPVPSSADLVEWARLLGDQECHGGAALLVDVAALDQGFSPALLANRARPFGSAVAEAGDDMAARTLAELRQLGQAVAAPAPAAPPDAAPHPADDVAGLAGLLRGLLERPLAGREGELAAALGASASAAARIAGLDHRTFAQAPLPVLVPAIAAVALADFTLRTRDLWGGPAGSPVLLHRVARFDGGGLGPYLSNIGRIARTSRDVADLARVARDAAVATGADPGSGAALEPWIALLSRGCDPDLLREVVDDLGDVAAGPALTTILNRVASPYAAVDLATAMRIRDAALDNADHLLAERAQQVVVRLRPQSELEGMILGAIQATGGKTGRAEATFRHWLARSPGHEGLRDRLAALAAGRFEPFALACGFGSPAHRQATRLRRRGIPPAYPRRRGERMDAVEVR